jgi:hypothetical protein
MTADLDLQRAKRRLRIRIARLRRRIDRRVRSVRDEGRRLVSWRTYVRRYPAQAVLAAMGLGLAASAGVSRRGLRLLGFHLVRRAVGKAFDRLGRELAASWAESKPRGPESDSSGAKDGRS